MQEVKKIIAIGPESTGKSTLCRLLAENYGAAWCPEFAREYLLKNGTDYTYNDLLTIAKGQVKLEDDYRLRALQEQGQPLLFVDTDMYVMKVWCEYVFGKCHQFITDKIAESKCDLYLLCNVDMPWVKDELREYPDLQTRKELYQIYRHILINQNVPWVTISGSYEDRLKTAIHAVDNLVLR